MKKMRFFAFAMAAVFTMGFVSCANDDDIEYDEFILHEGESISVEGYGYDTTASYPVCFDVQLLNNQLVVISKSSKPSEQAQQVPGMNNRDCTTDAKIASFGKVKALSKIDEYPAASEFHESALAEEGFGYVVEAHGSANLNSYSNPNLRDITSQYMRIWLEEAKDGGYKVRYEFPFKADE